MPLPEPLLVPPIVVVNRPDGVTLYESADDLTAQLEAWYVTDEGFDAYDAEGRLVELIVERQQIRGWFGRVRETGARDCEGC